MKCPLCEIKDKLIAIQADENELQKNLIKALESKVYLLERKG